MTRALAVVKLLLLTQVLYAQVEDPVAPIFAVQPVTTPLVGVPASTTSAIDQLLPEPAPQGRLMPTVDPAAMNSMPRSMSGTLQETNPALMSTPGQAASGSLSQSVSLGESGNISASLNPDPNATSLSSNYSFSRTFGWIRSADAGIYANEQQRLYTGGATFSLFETDGIGFGARALVTGSDYKRGSTDVGSSVDFFGGKRFRTRYGEHWLKGSLFYDYQGAFSRVGPALGGLFFANEKHPLTADFALGFGYGTNQIYANQSRIFENAIRDYQLRVGMYLTPRFQVGASVNLADFNTPVVKDSVFGGGAFANIYFNRVRFGMDLTGSETGVRGFLNMSILGGGARPVCKTCAPGEEWCVDGQTWLMTPVNRDLALRLRDRQRTDAERGTSVGNIVSVGGFVRYQGNAAPISKPLQNGDVIEIVPSVTAGSAAALNVVFSTTAPAITGPAALNSSSFTTTVPVLPAGQTVNSDQVGAGEGDFDITVNGSSGQIVVRFTVLADGITRTYQLSPLTVGQPLPGNLTAVPVN